MNGKILVIGAAGQIGTELVLSLRQSKGADNVIAADLKEPNKEVLAGGKFVQLDILDEPAVRTVINDNSITEVYLLAALLSATAEKNPMFAWKLNMDGLFNILNIAKEGIIKKVFWPSSIAVFGPSSPKENTPQTTIMEPITVYGISKQAGERWCEYYFRQYGVDVRSIRYPGLISYKSLPGGGTTDYAVDIYYKALENASFTCFLDENMKLPMMYMEDAIRATIELMDTPIENVKIRSSYNITGMSFSPKEIAQSIQNHIADFEINYSIDYRNKIAETWPDSISDSSARKDWNWKARYDLNKMTKNMLENLSL
ncbi:NAD-dependent epimerase/dehydratase family protein [Flavobacteriales bacterium]|nr:NAD-dependent epimerase/dehydratase family protein [Flavobacteriales bacterium]